MIAFLYPGQGAQRAGMLANLPDSVATRRTMEEAAELLPAIGELDTTEALTSTTNAQVALLISGVATARTLTDEHRVSPDIVAGHSVGAFAAAVGAGVLTFAEAVAAVRLRGDSMTRACASGQWGMAALTGLPLRAARDLVASEDADDRLWIANINAVDQVVLGGTLAALDDARQAARRAGARRFEMLDVAVASHGPLQRDTASAVAQHLSAIPHREQRSAYMTNVGARRIRDDPAAVLDDLADAVARPVRWFDIMRLLPELGVIATVEMPPGEVLSRLVTATTPAARVFSVDRDGLAPISARVRSLLVDAVPKLDHRAQDLLGPA
jgi:malonate decarboxylase epsilon subunit